MKTRMCQVSAAAELLQMTTAAVALAAVLAAHLLLLSLAAARSYPLYMCHKLLSPWLLRKHNGAKFLNTEKLSTALTICQTVNCQW